MGRDPDRLEFRKTSKPIAGVLFILVGGAALLGPFLGDFFSDIPIWVLLLTGFPFLLGGVWMAFGRSVIILDRRQRSSVTWWGLLIPFKTTTISLVNYRTVLISKEMRSTTRQGGTRSNAPVHRGSGTKTVYPIKLICEEEPPEAAIVAVFSEGGGAFDNLNELREVGVRLHELERTRKDRGMVSIPIDEPSNLTAARAKAERVAEFLGFKVRDLNSPEG